MLPGHSGGGLRSHSKLVLLFKASAQELDRNQDMTEHLHMTHKLCLRQLNLKTMSGRRETLHIELAKEHLLSTMAMLTQE